jgi:hypothetical protein
MADPDLWALLESWTIHRRAGHLDRPGTHGADTAGCREVKRDGTAGLVGCWIRLPPKAAPLGRLPRSRLTVATTGRQPGAI